MDQIKADSNDKRIVCSKCKIDSINDDGNIRPDSGYHRLNERYKSCVKCRKYNAEQKKWQGGPNAYWGQPRQPKVMSESELYRLMLMQQMAGGAGKPPQNIRVATENDDEPTLTF